MDGRVPGDSKLKTLKEEVWKSMDGVYIVRGYRS